MVSYVAKNDVLHYRLTMEVDNNIICGRIELTINYEICNDV